ncbi:MAG: methyltransferase domain-containing protein [Cyanobacteria bacterium Co-bin13]|nr:methyltransferase domain-containing protein [Cyanobacteria bacterium Co-bin13]
MATRKDTLFEQFLAPIFSRLLDREALLRYRNSINWQTATAALQNPQVDYPDYYQTAHFHGIKGGYLTPDAAVTYDPITQHVLPPGEGWVREHAVKTLQGTPRRILDLGCGTGSTTLMLKQTFPKAEVIGLDLSPHMLVVAQDKAQKAGLAVQFIHGNAMETGFPPASFDVVTASLLFHETPSEIACIILKEAFRLLTAGGQVMILDGNQHTLRSADWLTNIFEEPYIQDYARGSVDAWMGASGFEAVQTEDFWWLHQVSRGQKPLPAGASVGSQPEVESSWSDGFNAGSSAPMPA